MNATKLILITSICAGFLLLVAACGEKKQDIAQQAEPAAEAQPAVETPPAPQVPAAEKSVADGAPAIETQPAVEDEKNLLHIKEAALLEQAMILKKSDELQKLMVMAEKSAAPLTVQSGEAQESAQQIASLKDQIQQHRDRYNQCMLQLKAGDVDTSELTLE